MSRTAVIGGGYAGMAAAVDLADAGKPVTVFEAAKELGGRARRVTLGGVALDNGQHILLGAYREVLALIGRVHPGAAHAMLRQPLSIFIAGEFRLDAARLPAPFDLVLGLARARGLGIGERFAAAAFMLRMRLSRFRLPEDTNVAALLRDAGQGERAVRLLWGPLCVSALNTNTADASAQVFLNVLKDGLLGGSGDSDLVIPREDLTSLFPAPAAAYVATRGGNMLTGTTIRDIVAIPGGYCLGGDPGAACYDNIVIAVSPHRLAPLIAALPALGDLAAMVGRFDYEPISTCYLQYAGTVRLPEPMTGMPQGNGRIGQWAFDRGVLSGHQGLVAIVVSASGPQQSLAQEELAARLNAELAAIVPGLPQPAWSRVITEKRATYSCRPGMVRPAVRTALPGIFLAGDYLESRYPATLEAAVRSGRAAARCVLARRG